MTERYAIPLHDVLEIRKVPVSDITFAHKPSILIGEEDLPFYDLSVYVGLRQNPQDHLNTAENATVLIVAGERNREVLTVDTIVEQQEIIVKDLGSHLKHVHGISGATIMGDGSLVPILNLSELVASPRSLKVERTPLPTARKRATPAQCHGCG